MSAPVGRPIASSARPRPACKASPQHPPQEVEQRRIGEPHAGLEDRLVEQRVGHAEGQNHREVEPVQPGQAAHEHDDQQEGQAERHPHERVVEHAAVVPAGIQAEDERPVVHRADLPARRDHHPSGRLALVEEVDLPMAARREKHGPAQRMLALVQALHLGRVLGLGESASGADGKTRRHEVHVTDRKERYGHVLLHPDPGRRRGGLRRHRGDQGAERDKQRNEGAAGHQGSRGYQLEPTQPPPVPEHEWMMLLPVLVRVNEPLLIGESTTSV